MSYTTQCPACQTRFKVSDAHLALAAGMVRCGRCSHVFHAPSHFEQAPTVAEAPLVISTPANAANTRAEAAADDDFELELPDFHPERDAANLAASAEPRAAAVSAPDETALDLPDFDLLPEPEQPLSWQDLDTPPRQDDTPPAEPQQDIAAFQRALAEALQTPASRASEPVALIDEPPAPTTPAPNRQQRLAAQYDTEHTDSPLPPISAADLDDDAPAPAASNHDAETEESDTARSTGDGSWLRATAFGLLGVIGVLLLLLQLAFINRTAVSAELPELRPAFESLCQSLGCEVPLPTQRQLIRTEWSELSFVPQHEHLIQLDATLKNLAPYPQAFPLMEVSLKDGEDRVLIRKTLKPEQYLSADDLKLGRFNASSELKIVTRMEVRDAKALGYSLHFYYP
ncbi:putative Zn finger-like uncharacterized protein [Vogesella indigofera]|uniref:Putative Zn finger-like uncharacterized protein n=1 Tax=Vogesella indigofera TaxID=45465 RepID=A0A495BD80_VOGIN|nr:DUF3426 domain-containing protein [Vogesella indigofera]RKQ58941.1 putative Zn finger-like uncharacterized protein [Vogesella indigofera]